MDVLNRVERMAAVVQRLEADLHLLCLTDVEDRFQDEVTTSLELLKNAGIRVWMLTGDKLETAISIAKSSGLFSKSDNIHAFGQVETRTDIRDEPTEEISLIMNGADNVLSKMVLYND